MNTQTCPETRFMFKDAENTKTKDLISFSKKYLEETKKLITFFKNNEGKYVNLFFTRLLPNGHLKPLKELLGIAKNVKDLSFDFVNAFNLSGYYLTDDEIINHIRLDNVLGIIPIPEGFDLDQVFKNNDSKMARKYFSYLDEIQEELKKLIGTTHYVELFFKESVIECEILSVNKSNLLVLQKRMYDPEIDKKTGTYKSVDLVTQKRNILFIQKDDFLRGLEIHLFYLNINPHDED